LVTCPLLPEEKPKREFKFRSSRPLRRVTTIVSPQSFLESSESEFDNTQMVIPSFHSLPKISPTSHTVEATNSPPKDVGGDLTTDKVPPTTNFLASAKKIAFIDIVNFSEKTKQRDSEEIDIDEELLRNATDVENRMGVEMNGVNPPANDLNFANVPNFCSKFGNRHRFTPKYKPLQNDDEVSEVCVLAPPNTPVDVDHREGIGVQ
uniref:Protein aurora borealis n=1 Tax=Angiostrongylus cantonensis TaxID=6313 RepID=A0A0K0D6C4_ANGCA